jgi:hypothetical protein
MALFFFNDYKTANLDLFFGLEHLLEVNSTIILSNEDSSSRVLCLEKTLFRLNFIALNKAITT